MHKKTVLYAIPKGVCHCIASLTSFNETNSMKTLDQVCLVYAKALHTAGLIKNNNFPKLIDCVPTTTKLTDTNFTNLDNDTSNV